jgi:hypothetical protein
MRIPVGVIIDVIGDACQLKETGDSPQEIFPVFALQSWCWKLGVQGSRSEHQEMEWSKGLTANDA